MKKWILFPLLAALFLSACQKTERTTEYTPDESMRLTIYTSHKEEVYMPIVREFEERTGIWVALSLHICTSSNSFSELIYEKGNCNVS